jgi:flagellar protein FlaG
MSNIQSIQTALPQVQGLESRGSPVPSQPAVQNPQGAVPAQAQPVSEKTSPSRSEQNASRETLQKAVDQANRKLQTLSSNELQFSIDKETGIQVVKLTDKQTGEVIRQIPSEEMLKIAKSIESMTGSLVSQQV